jgi:retinol dehydrogenase 12
MGDQELAGQTFLITGANTGIGRVTAEQLALHGARVLLACRSEEKTRPVVESIHVGGGLAEFVALDLADLVSVRRCADELLGKGIKLNGLINNAGLAGKRGVTKQGFEIAFGTNHLGHFLLTTLLLPAVQAVSGRIVSVSSKAHYDAKPIYWDDLKQPTKHTTGLPEYAASKLCNILFIKELARGKAGAGVHAYALHPGVVASDAWREMPWPIRPLIKLFMISNDEGAKTTLHCATSSDVAKDSGLYYDLCKPKRPSTLAEDPDGIEDRE